MPRIAVLAVLILSSLLLTTPAPAATACADRILRDWSADGRVASSYSLPCYEEAIEALPTDLRDYTNAEEVISRALASATRAGKPQPASAQTSGIVGAETDSAGKSALIGLLVAGSLALAVLGAGGLGYVLRRRRTGDGPDGR